MKTVTRMVDDEIYEAINENGNAVTIDMRKNEVRRNQSPPELLLSALAGCGAVDVVTMLKKRKKTVEELIIETTGTRQEEEPRYFTAIHCHYIMTSPDATTEELDKIVRLSLDKYCSVASSLKSKITFSTTINRKP
jgi:putative redox protein